jgi:MFS family permease
MGISTDRLSIRHIMAVSFLLVALSRFGLIISTSFPVICGFAFFGSFGVRFYMTATNSLFFKVTGPDNLRKAGQFQALRMVAMGGGLIIGSLVIGFYSFRHAFIVTVAANLALAIMALLLPRTGQVSLKLEEYREAIFTPQVLFIALVFTLSSLHWGAEMVAYTPFLREVLQLSMTHTGLYTGIGFFFVGAGAYLGVILIEKKWVTSLQTVLVLGFLLSGIFHILMVIPNPWWSFAFRMLHEVGDGLVFVVFYHGIARIFKLDRIGGCAAFMSLCMGLGSVGSSVLFGHISDLYGYQWPLIISGVVMVLVPILLRLSPYSRMEQEEAV